MIPWRAGGSRWDEIENYVEEGIFRERKILGKHVKLLDLVHEETKGTTSPYSVRTNCFLKYAVLIVFSQAELFGGIGVEGDNVADRQYDVVLEVISSFLVRSDVM